MTTQVKREVPVDENDGGDGDDYVGQPGVAVVGRLAAQGVDEDTIKALVFVHGAAQVLRWSGGRMARWLDGQVVRWSDGQVVRCLGVQVLC